MMCLMRNENEREREVIVMKDDVDEMNNTCVVGTAVILPNFLLN